MSEASAFLGLVPLCYQLIRLVIYCDHKCNWKTQVYYQEAIKVEEKSTEKKGFKCEWGVTRFLMHMASTHLGPGTWRKSLMLSLAGI